MVRLGWLSDMHFRPPGSERTDAASIFQTNYDDLLSRGVGDIYLTGDLVHPPSSGSVPHVSTDAYDRVWDTILGGTSDGGAAVKRAIPGNHDVPIQGFVQSDERAILRERIDYDADNLSVFLLNTQAASMVTGSPGQKGGVGEAQPWMPRADIEWLQDQLDSLDSSRAKLLLPHAHLFPGLINPSFFQGAPTLGEEYEYIHNWPMVADMLKNYNNVVTCSSHGYFTGNKSETRFNGETYVAKEHWSNDSDPANPDDYHYIDIDGSGCQVTAVSQDGTTNTFVDVTF